MKLNQAGTVNNGQHGTIIAVFANGGIFRADNGVEYTVVKVEFVADVAPTKARQAQAVKIAAHNRIEHPVTPRKTLDAAFATLAAEGYGAAHL